MWFTLVNRSLRPLIVCILFSFGLGLGKSAFSATSTDICTVVLTDSQSVDLFGHAELGSSIVTYMDVLNRYITKVEADPARSADLFLDPVFRKKFDLINYYRSFVFPLVQQYLSNHHLRSDTSLEKGLLELAEEERQTILKEMEAHNASLIPDLLSLAGLKGDSVIIELGREKDTRIDANAMSQLYKMYSGFARHMGWKFEELQASYVSYVEHQGLKNATFRLTGAGVYQYMMFESGTHRFIDGASDGRKTFTNLVRARVYHEPAPLEFNFSQNDLEFKTARSSGAGGQHVNKTESAVRVRHIPTGLEVNIETDRSQHNNRATAVAILRAKVYEKHLEEQEKIRAASRNGAVGYTNDERYVRTYDDRYNRTELASMLEGNLAEIIRVRQREYLAQHLPLLMMTFDGLQ